MSVVLSTQPQSISDISQRATYLVRYYVTSCRADVTTVPVSPHNFTWAFSDCILILFCVNCC